VSGRLFGTVQRQAESRTRAFVLQAPQTHQRHPAAAAIRILPGPAGRRRPTLAIHDPKVSSSQISAGLSSPDLLGGDGWARAEGGGELESSGQRLAAVRCADAVGACTEWGASPARLAGDAARCGVPALACSNPGAIPMQRRRASAGLQVWRVVRVIDSFGWLKGHSLDEQFLVTAAGFNLRRGGREACWPGAESVIGSRTNLNSYDPPPESSNAASDCDGTATFTFTAGPG